ncbi:hypothetical protein CAPTEDRAFT_156025 [Capitella teleta]|uniref:Kynurenine/alpha-aminoadipate aminotransferase, mitochondrial n=1 Tax=Capitella teleta TaxID=283909 RepID=R7UM92_CAPTE|nr:hypothetical protein CAPTEDRAFT_156025 [Capitella teleta]|eukprot:ELU04387.1 hypothetical protein CAPTEDRAFT_156025 [Capitella teleta]
MNYTRFLNPVSLARQPSPIRVLTAILARSPPSMISLAAGSPNVDLFPFKEAEIKLRDGTTMHLDEKKMKTALQYGATPGHGDLLKFLKEMQKTLHNPPTFDRPPDEGGLDVCVTTGSQDGICKSMEMLINPGDNILIDSPTYAGTLAILRPLGCNMLSVATDHQGMIPDALQDVLSRWKPSEKRDPQSSMPRVLYTIPNGVNPTGASLTLKRKEQIYKIAQDYDLLIMEDDPYYFLQYSERAPTFLSLDVDGRVLRFDSFSKVLSSGLRVGFVSGPRPLVNRIEMHMMASVMHTPMMSQMLVSELLNMWGMDGFLKHVDEVVDFYRDKKDSTIKAAEKHLTGLAEWHEPVAGMFLWMKLKGIEDTKSLIEEKAARKEVLLVPGCAFMADDTAPCPYVRASFSLASKENIDLGLSRLAALIREEISN